MTSKPGPIFADEHGTSTWMAELSVGNPRVSPLVGRWEVDTDLWLSWRVKINTPGQGEGIIRCGVCGET